MSVEHRSWIRVIAEHGSGLVSESIEIPGEPDPLLVSDDETHLYFRGHVYQLEER